MKENDIYLTQHQVYAFMHKIGEIRKNDPSFNNEIARDFEEYVIGRAAKIATTYPQIKLKLIPNANKFKISKKLFDYLTKLTSVDVYDKETMKKYMEIEKEAQNLFFKEGLEGLQKLRNIDSEKTK